MDLYGAQQRENTTLTEVGGHSPWADARTVAWTAKGLKFVRVRLLSDVGFPVWDISYIYGIVNGEKVRVSVPFHQIPKGKAFRRFLYAEAKAAGVFLNGSGFFEALSTLQ
jgi:hypothetical protein